MTEPISTNAPEQRLSTVSRQAGCEKEPLPTEAATTAVEVEDNHGDKTKPETFQTKPSLEETKGSGQNQTHLHRTRGDPEGEEEQVEPTSNQGGQSRWPTRDGQET